MDEARGRRDPRVVVFTDDPGWHGRVLQRAFAARGLTAIYASLGQCRLECGGGTPQIVIPGFAGALPRGAFVRGIAGGTLEEVVLRLDVLHGLALLGVPVFNTGRAIERTVDKGMTSFLLGQRGIATPGTWICESAGDARAIAQKVFARGRALVLKPLFGSQGEGLVKLTALAEFAAAPPPAGVYYLQEYVAREGPPYRDWRVLVVAGQARLAMQRVSAHWVTNRAQGAECRRAELTAEMRDLAEAAAAAVAVDYAGVDLMQDADGRLLVGEVNGVPAWWGLQQACGEDVTALLAEAFVARLARGAAGADAG